MHHRNICRDPKYSDDKWVQVDETLDRNLIPSNHYATTLRCFHQWKQLEHRNNIHEEQLRPVLSITKYTRPTLTSVFWLSQYYKRAIFEKTFLPLGVFLIVAGALVMTEGFETAL